MSDTHEVEHVEDGHEDAQADAVDTTAAQPDEAAEEADEESQLQNFIGGVREQDDLERDIGRQADQMLTEQADERDKKRLEKTEQDKSRYEEQLRQLRSRLSAFGNHATKEKIRKDIATTEVRIAGLDEELEQIKKRMDDRHRDAEDGQDTHEGAGNQRLPNESRRDFLIRTGKITPFSKMASLPRQSSNLADVMLEAEVEEEGDEEDADEAALEELAKAPVSHRNLMRPGFADEADSASDASVQRATKRRRVQTRREAEEDSSVEKSPEEEYVPGEGDFDEEDDEESDELDPDAFDVTTTPAKRKVSRKKAAAVNEDDEEDLAGVDDGNEGLYQKRLQSWIRRRSQARRRAHERSTGDGPGEEDGMLEDDSPEWQQPHPTLPDTEFDGGYKIPGDIYPSLFDYQKTGVQWLWELYSQQVGGIIGDEMGLGKTIQIISFLAGLHYSGKVTKPIIVVCPATVMRQWVNEFHRWWPPLRVSILHSSGSGMLDMRRERDLEEELETQAYGDGDARPMTRSEHSAKRIVDRVKRDGHVLVTTYSGLQSYAKLLIPTEWEYAVLDEGHKIRNPNTAITIYCKELRTPNRIILSGTPMQNNLTELWSLFDFVFPMRLGTLVNFRSQFEFPIKQGGYANASNLQVETAMRCAEALKETISGYLLQRFKIDVAADLPKKSERVLFCKLTKIQRSAYEDFLGSEEMKSISEGKRQALYGVDLLRKICNHPDLTQHKTLSKKPGYNYGSGAKSGKMQVVKGLLEIWKKHGHKTLLFAQHRIMLDILETFVKGLSGFNYRRMDGTTAIKDRQDMVDEFNRDPDLHVFLLTTKVGGLGVNLTGADRVIIYDPDWNPSTDVQARERAWRLGQKREVEIYRLMTAGTIEEKIYHRQIFKQFLTNKILKDPKQRQTFQMRDLHDLFTLGDDSDETETGTLFKGTEVKFDEKSQGIPTPPTDTDPKQAVEDVATITGVAKQEAFQAPAESAPQADGESSTTDGKNDDRLLSALFSRSGVHSALEHDAILGSNSGKKKVQADPEMISREAKRVASEAARELKRAGEAARAVPIGTPTWTGVVGTAGRPEERPRPSASMRGGRGGARGGRGGGLNSSTSILANLEARQGNRPTPDHRGGGSASSSRASTPQPPQPKGKEFIALIRDYLSAHGGRVYTQMLIDHFNRYCGTEQRTLEFKEMLKQVARLEKGGRGRARWVLRDEFKGAD